jgi:hypothetical protein
MELTTRDNSGRWVSGQNPTPPTDPPKYLDATLLTSPVVSLATAALMRVLGELIWADIKKLLPVGTGWLVTDCCGDQPAT